MRRKILISGPAQKDIEQIVQYIRLDKPLAAEKFKMNLKKKVRSLVRFPEKGRKVPELKKTPFEDYRELILYPCRIIYKLHPAEIRVVRVLHGRQIFSLF